jgi:hypothetical protein
LAGAGDHILSGGTASGGSSTPRSPRATITASASATISMDVDRCRLLDLRQQRRAFADQGARLGFIFRPLDERQCNPVGFCPSAKQIAGPFRSAPGSAPGCRGH